MADFSLLDSVRQANTGAITGMTERSTPAVFDFLDTVKKANQGDLTGTAKIEPPKPPATGALSSLWAGTKAGIFYFPKSIGDIVEYAATMGEEHPEWAAFTPLKEFGANLNEYWNKRVQANAGRVQNFTDIDWTKPSDIIDWSMWNIGQMAGQMVTTIPFMVGKWAQVGQGAITGWQAIKGLFVSGNIKQFARWAGDWAAFKPMDIPIGIQEAGQVLGGQLERLHKGETEELNPIRALAATFVATKLEELGAEATIQRLFRTGTTGVQGKLFRRIGRQALATGIGEGTEEFFQQYAEQAGVDPTQLDTKQTFMDAVNGAAAGFIGGAAMGGGAGAMSSSKKTTQKYTDVADAFNLRNDIEQWKNEGLSDIDITRRVEDSINLHDKTAAELNAKLPEEKQIPQFPDMEAKELVSAVLYGTGKFKPEAGLFSRAGGAAKRGVLSAFGMKKSTAQTTMTEGGIADNTTSITDIGSDPARVAELQKKEDLFNTALSDLTAENQAAVEKARQEEITRRNAEEAAAAEEARKTNDALVNQTLGGRDELRTQLAGEDPAKQKIFDEVMGLSERRLITALAVPAADKKTPGLGLTIEIDSVGLHNVNGQVVNIEALRPRLVQARIAALDAVRESTSASEQAAVERTARDRQAKELRFAKSALSYWPAQRPSEKDITLLQEAAAHDELSDDEKKVLDKILQAAPEKPAAATVAPVTEKRTGREDVLSEEPNPEHLPETATEAEKEKHDYLLSLMESQLDNTGAATTVERPDHTYIKLPAGVDWLTDVNKTGIEVSKEDARTVINKAKLGKNMTARQRDIYDAIIEAARARIPDRHLEAPLWEKKGFTPVEEGRIPAKDLIVGDRFVISGEEFTVTEIDDQGNVTMKNGVIRKVKEDAIIKGVTFIKQAEGETGFGADFFTPEGETKKETVPAAIKEPVAPEVLAEYPDLKTAEAKTPASVQTLTGKKQEAGGAKSIGKNSEGEDVYEDKNGVRHVVENGIQLTEPVAMVPTKTGVVAQPATPRDNRYEVTALPKEKETPKPATMKTLEEGPLMDAVGAISGKAYRAIERGYEFVYGETKKDSDIYWDMVGLFSGGSADRLVQAGITIKKVTEAPKETLDLSVSGQSRPLPGYEGVNYVVHKRTPDLIPDTYKVVIARQTPYLSVHGTGMTAKEAYDRALYSYEQKQGTPKPASVGTLTGATLKTVYHKNYQILAKLFDKWGLGKPEDLREHKKLKAPGFMDFNVEHLRTDDQGEVLALSHYYEQNGDLVADPDMEVRVTKHGTLEALTFQDYRTYQAVYPEPGKVDLKLKKQLNSFLNTWLKNLNEQRHTPEVKTPAAAETEKKGPVVGEQLTSDEFDRVAQEAMAEVNAEKTPGKPAPAVQTLTGEKPASPGTLTGELLLSPEVKNVTLPKYKVTKENSGLYKGGVRLTVTEGPDKGKTAFGHDENNALPELRRIVWEREKSRAAEEKPKPSLAKAGEEVIKGFDASLDAVAEILKQAGKNKNTISMFGGSVFSEDVYRAVKPHLLDAYNHFQAAGREVKDWIVEVIGSLKSRGIPPDVSMAYVKHFYMNDLPAQPGQTGTHWTLGTLENINTVGLAEEFVPVLNWAQKPLTREDVYQALANIYGKSVEEVKNNRDLNMRDVEEAVELAIVQSAGSAARDIYGTVDDHYQHMIDLYNNQPNLNVRTTTSIQNQQYSTPAPLAYLMDRYLDLTPENTLKVFEPTAGNGMLIMGADPVHTTANELEKGRYERLKSLGFNARNEDALDYFKAEGHPDEKHTYDRVVMNPPFGKAERKEYDGFPITKLDHQVIIESLAGMKDDGKAAFIIGGHNYEAGIAARPGVVRMTEPDRIFLNYLYSHYNVTHNIDISGEVFRKMGTSFPIRMITIEGRKTTPDRKFAPSQAEVEKAVTFDDVKEILDKDIKGTKIKIKEAGTNEPVSTERPGSLGTEGEGLSPGSAKPGEVYQPGGGRQSGGKLEPDLQQPGGGRLSPGQSTLLEETAARRGAEKSEPKPGAGEESRPGEPSGGIRQGPRTGLETAGAFQETYQPRSKAPAGNNFVPRSMAPAIKNALDKIEKKYGDVDNFVRDELKYDNNEKLYDAFSAEQIDALAFALDNIKNNAGMIIGDQTGVGKGRVVAGIIRWANLNGMKPLFFTAKPKLFTDMYRDLTDIGHDIRPFIMHNDPTAASILDSSGNVVYRPNGGPDVYKRMVNMSPESFMTGFKAMFVPYSQVQQPNRQQQIVLALAKDNIVILDESHEASGGESNRGRFIRNLIAEAKGVLYSSATYAKRPDTMPLYYRTALSDAGMEMPDLVNAISNGGNALQEWVADILARMGQYIRREMSFDGIPFQTKINFANEARNIQTADGHTQGLRAIVDFDRLKQDYVRQLNDEMREQGGAASGGRMELEAGITSTNFTSVVHNFVRQLLLSVNAQHTVDEVLLALKEGRKPVVNLMNTMESFIDHLAQEEGLHIGDPIGFNFSDVLKKALSGTLRYRTMDERGNEAIARFNPDEFPEALRNAYYATKRLVDGIPSDIPASPIDYIKAKVQEAGYKVSEITGRQLYIDYTKDVPTLEARTSKEIKDRNKPNLDFNNGGIDALIINSAGSTGISLHAGEKVKDQKPRRMLIAQPDLNIDTFMQALGRIYRKGGVNLPEYVLLQSALPAEIRPANVLQRKMRSLNANTTASVETDNTLRDIPDMMNTYGDRVTSDYLRENEDLANALHVDPGEEAGELYKRVTGRLALMPVAMQKEFFADVEDNYKALIEYLNQVGENTLVTHDYDFGAQTLSRSRIAAGRENAEGELAGPAWIERESVKVLKKPYRREKVAELVKEALDLKEGSGGALEAKTANDNLMTRIRETTDRYLEEQGHDLPEHRRELVQRQLGDASYNLQRLKIGDTYSMEIAGGRETQGVLIGIHWRPGKTGSPAAASRLAFVFALPDSIQTLTLPASNELLTRTRFYQRGISSDWNDMLPTERREERYILTGNLLQGYNRLATRGEMIRYTTEKGDTVRGILLPRHNQQNTVDRLSSTTATTEDAYNHFIKQYEGALITSTNSEVRICYEDMDRHIFKIAVPKSKRLGAKYFELPALLALVRHNQFVSRGNRMEANIEGKANLKKVLEVLAKNTGTQFLIPSTWEKVSEGETPGTLQYSLEEKGKGPEQALPAKGIVVKDSVPREQLKNDSDWIAGKEDSDLAAAERFAEKTWTTKHTDRLLTVLGNPEDILFISQPSTTGENAQPLALAKKLADETKGQYAAGEDFFNVLHEEASKGISRSERVYNPREYEARSLDQLKDLAKDRKVVLVEDIFTTGGSAAEFIRTLARNGVIVDAHAGYYGETRLRVDPNTLDKLQKALQNANIPIKGKELENLLTWQEAGAIIQNINKVRTEDDRKEITGKLQRLLDLGTARNVATNVNYGVTEGRTEGENKGNAGNTERVPHGHPQTLTTPRRLGEIPLSKLVQDLAKTVKGLNVKEVDGRFYIETASGDYVRIEEVNHITPDQVSVKMGYGLEDMRDKLAVGSLASTKTTQGQTISEMKLVRDKAGFWTVTHEFYHFLEDAGLITNADKNVLNNKISALIAKDQATYGHLEGRTKVEARADWVGKSLAGIYDATTPTGKILQKIKNIIDAILNTLGIRTSGGVMRDIRTGKVFEQQEEKAGTETLGTSYALEDIWKEKAVRPAGEKISQAVSTLTGKIAPAKQDTLQTLKKHWLEFWKPFSTVPGGDQALARRYEAMGNVAKATRYIEQLHDKMDVFPDDVKKDMFWYLNGSIPAEALPTESYRQVKEKDGTLRDEPAGNPRELAQLIQKRTEVIGEMLVSRGIITEEQFKKYEGKYIHYMYAKHILGEDKPIFLTNTGKLNLSYTKSRNPNLTLQQRRELGLVEDASVAVPVGMGKALTDIAKFDYLATIAENSEWVWQPSIVAVPLGKTLTQPIKGRTRRMVRMGIGKLVEQVKLYDEMMRVQPSPEVAEVHKILTAALAKAEEQTMNVPADFVQLPTSKTYGPLAGAYVLTPIADDIKPVLDISTDRGKLLGTILSIERQGMATFKMGKVALNLPTCVRNIVSNIMQINMSGRPLAKIPGDVIEALKSMKAKDAYHEEAFGMGLFKSNWFVTEINDVLEEFRKAETGRWDKVLGAVKNIAKYYGKIDDVFKLAIFIQQRKAGATIDKATIEAMKWGMDYSLASRSVKALRQTIVPFATYQYKIAPLIAESLKKRPWVLAKYALIYPLAKMVAMSLHGLDDDDWDDLEKQLPAYIKKSGSMMILPWKSDKGQWQWVNLEYFFPWGNYLAMFRDMKAKDLGEFMRDSGLGNPFLSMFTTGMSAREDQPPLHSYFGTAIYNQLDPGWMKAAKMLEFMANTWLPSMITRQGALGFTAKAFMGGEDRWGREVSFGQALGRWFGVNIVSVSPEQTRAQASVQIQDLRKEMSRVEADPRYDEAEKQKYRARLNEKLAEIAGEAPAAVLPITKGKGHDPVYEALKDMAAKGILKTGPPGRTVEIGGIPLQMTMDQYREYLEKSSELARKRLASIIEGPNWASLNDKRKEDIVSTVVSNARKAVRQKIKIEVGKDNREKIQAEKEKQKNIS